MYEIIMMLAFLYAAICQLLPRKDRFDKPDLLRKKSIAKKAREWTEESVTKPKTGQQKPVRYSNRKPALHLQHDRLRQASEKAAGIKLNCVI